MATLVSFQVLVHLQLSKYKYFVLLPTIVQRIRDKKRLYTAFSPSKQAAILKIKWTNVHWDGILCLGNWSAVSPVYMLTPLSVEAIVLTTLLHKEPLQRPDLSTWIRDDMNMNHNGKSYGLFLEIVCGWSSSPFFFLWILMKSYETDTKPHRAFRSVCSN